LCGKLFAQDLVVKVKNIGDVVFSPEIWVDTPLYEDAANTVTLPFTDPNDGRAFTFELSMQDSSTLDPRI